MIYRYNYGYGLFGALHTPKQEPRWNYHRFKHHTKKARKKR